MDDLEPSKSSRGASSRIDEEPHGNLQYNNDFWVGKLGQEMAKAKTWRKFHLIFSLIVFLGIPLAQFLIWVFSSQIFAVRIRAGNFMQGSGHDSALAQLYKLWHQEWPNSIPILHLMAQDCAQEISVKESNSIITNKKLSVKIKDLTVSSITALLHPRELMKTYREHAPFTWSILEAFTMEPNRYRKRKEAREQRAAAAAHDQGETDEEYDSDGEKTEAEAESELLIQAGLAITVVLGMLSFLRNRRTNLLPLLLGLFLVINGSSTRVMHLLGNIGLTVSSRTIERLKEQITQNAINFAAELISSGHLYFIIYDNINIYLRKFEQRMTNRNAMLNITNSAVIAIDEDGLDPGKTFSLEERLKMQGLRKNANWAEDIRPSSEDQVFILRSFRWLVTEIIVSHVPGHEDWKGRKEMLEQVENLMPEDRPLPPKKTDARPFGVFDVNEGTKKGQAELDEQMRKRAQQDEASWSSRVGMRMGDWLTASLIRLLRRDRADEQDSIDRLDFVEEQSALWHFALQATHMIMKTHYGIEGDLDPTSLAWHKSQLNRVWDASKPNYAAAKSLIRHSLIARILHIIMVLKGFRTWSQLENWRPDMAEINTIVERVLTDYVSPSAASEAKKNKDDWMAHAVYFIRDSLFFLEFEAAVSYADPGRVLRILKFWAVMFRGSGQHNYARECVEVLIRFKHETPPLLRKAMERAWFYNRWGLRGRSIAADLYLEQLNFWVKRVFVATGNGVTVQYIIKKGSACVEAFREISHQIATVFGDPDRARRHKEVKFSTDLRTLVEDLERHKVHHKSTEEHFVPAKPRKNSTKPPESRIVDIQVIGTGIWSKGNFSHYISSTTYDPEGRRYPLGNPARAPGEKHQTESGETDGNQDSKAEEEYDMLSSGTVFDEQMNPLDTSNEVDLQGDSSLGGGDLYSTGEVTIE